MKAWVLVLVLFPLGALGQGVHDERTRIHERLLAERTLLEGLRGKKLGVQEVLAFIDRMNDASVRKARALDVELKVIRRRIELAERRESLARKAQAELSQRLGPRLLVHYRSTRRNPLDVLLSARDFASLVRTSRSLSRMVEGDLELLEQVHRAALHQERSLEQLDRLKVSIADRLERLKDARTEAEERRADLSDLLESVHAEARQSSRVITELQAAERSLAELIAEMESDAPASGFRALKGSLPMPTDGMLEVGFGKIVNPRFNTVTIQKGMDIRARFGAPVQAVAEGKIVYTGWLRGYGNLVILEHGGGYHTVLAHLAQVTGQVGEEVQAGDELGQVGDTGSIKGPYLYFELRFRGIAVDPSEWLSGAGLGQ